MEIAQKEGCDAICHGCTGKGNDQVRFELAIRAHAPDMPIIAPWREWSIKSRDEEIDYAEAHNVPLKIDLSLIHISPVRRPAFSRALRTPGSRRAAGFPWNILLCNVKRCV